MMNVTSDAVEWSLSRTSVSEATQHTASDIDITTVCSGALIGRKHKLFEATYCHHTPRRKIVVNAAL